ncbi:hypothetical protein FSB78_03400 [Sphingomonas ginsenosidivorax]|uniref:Glycosyltransferase RgtA/B/C/D-like domain-containing protein n=1 Tax=Sphingomonas ginsenosidivorax TaxID=862135 RepID=A0A5C6UD18_9SPHN|nr:hypothetical protein [Sphingomonas ginsenosidivorax]TXC70101.1 hypothetical protein FSB78_03400 [Sphingomonas ginsenosidivorax]
MTARRGAYGAIGLAMLVGLALRLATARGGLWLDEAWSAYFVKQAATPLGVLWQINHDNNHFLNSWWMLLVGPYAPPMLVRALSIATGVASIGLAGAIGLRRGTATGVVAALLVAVSPIMMAYGAEARGYGPMVTVMLVAILVVDRWLDGEREAPVWPLAALTLLGMLAQFTYIFALAALGGWIVATLSRRMTLDEAVRSGLRTLAPSIGAVVLVVAVVVAAAHASTAGFQTGGYPGFTIPGFSGGLEDAVVHTFGLSLGSAFATIGVAAVASAAAILLAPGMAGRRFLYALAVLAFPAMLALALSRINNAGFARYYFLACIGLVLLVAELSGAAIARGGWRRAVAVVLLAVVVVASLSRDRALALALRGDPGRAVATMRMAAPAGTSVGVDTIRPTAVLEAAARTAGYSLDIRRDCPAAAFVFIDLEDHGAAPARLERCGQSYARIAVGRYFSMSGFDWSLYARTPPQSNGVSGH